MCKCTPNIRTPFCGKPGCEWPKDTNKDANPKADPEIQLNHVAFAKAWNTFVFCEQECTMDKASILEAAICCYLLYTNNCAPKRTPLRDLNLNFGTGKPSDRPEIVAAIKAEYDMLQQKEEKATKWQHGTVNSLRRD